jgi:hypothetical protein
VNRLCCIQKLLLTQSTLFLALYFQLGSSFNCYSQVSIISIKMNVDSGSFLKCPCASIHWLTICSLYFSRSNPNREQCRQCWMQSV